MMRLPEEVIICPYVTEKTALEADYGKYTFVVNKKSTKTEIRKAAELLFDVKVLKVTTMNYEGKLKRLRSQPGRRPDWKKAIIKIDLDPKPGEYLSEGGKKVSGGKKYKSDIPDFI